MEYTGLNIGTPDPNAYPDIELNYYYSREKRLENAPDRIKRIYEPPRKGGFFRSLTDSAPKLMLLITIVVLCVVIAILRYAMQ